MCSDEQTSHLPPTQETWLEAPSCRKAPMRPASSRRSVHCSICSQLYAVHQVEKSRASWAGWGVPIVLVTLTDSLSLPLPAHLPGFRPPQQVRALSGHEWGPPCPGQKHLSLPHLTLRRTCPESLPFFFFVFLPFLGPLPAAYGGSQARGLIGAVAISLHQSHSNAGSEPRL